MPHLTIGRATIQQNLAAPVGLAPCTTRIRVLGRGISLVARISACVLAIGCHQPQIKGKLAVIPHRISGLLWLSEHVGIGEAAKRHQLAVEWSGPNDEGSLEEQSELTDRAIHDGAAGIILSPNVNRVFKRKLLQAREHHIPVVLEGESAGIEPMPGVSFILSNLDETGKLIAQRLGEVLDHHGEVLIAGLDPYTPGNVERSDAIATALQKYEPGIEVSERVFGTPSPAHSEMLIYQALQAHSNVRAIVSLSAGESVAAASATRVSGKLPNVKIIGCDQSQPVFMLLHMGVLDSIVVQDNRRQGNLAVDTISDMLSGLYDSRTIYVSPVLVTRDNIGTEPVQQLLLMHR